MSAGLKLVTAPASEPVSVSDAKSYLRIDGSADDSIIALFITAARELVEKHTNKKLINQTWDLWLDAFPGCYNFDALPEGVSDGKLSEYLSPQRFIEIPVTPLQSITFLKTYDDGGTAYTMSSSDYIADTAQEPARISLKTSTVWPSTVLRPVNGIQIEFVAGYGTASTSVPGPLRQAVLELTGKFYESRGCQDSTIPSGVLALLAPYRLMRI